jgi:hypothetical protein
MLSCVCLASESVVQCRQPPAGKHLQENLLAAALYGDADVTFLAGSRRFLPGASCKPHPHSASKGDPQPSTLNPKPRTLNYFSPRERIRPSPDSTTPICLTHDSTLTHTRRQTHIQTEKSSPSPSLCASPFPCHPLPLTLSLASQGRCSSPPSRYCLNRSSS